MAEQILYDLIVHEEWKQEPEILVSIIKINLLDEFVLIDLLLQLT